MATPTQIDPKDYFVVRAKEGEENPYSQHEGYQLMMTFILEQMNKNPKDNAKDYLLQSAALMNCLHAGYSYEYTLSEERIPKSFLEDAGKVLKQFPYGVFPIHRKNPECGKYFGPMKSKNFGITFPDAISQAITMVGNFEHDMARVDNGFDLFSSNGSNYRNYHKYLFKNILFYQTISESDLIELPDESIPNIQFDYTSKSGRQIDMLEIGSVKGLEKSLLEGLVGGEADYFTQLEFIMSYNSYKILYCAPIRSEEKAEQFYEILDELFAELELNSEEKFSGELPKEKHEALADTYWLVAQSILTIRGASAQANLTLRDIESQLQQQGYDFEIPLCKAGTDLWAEAATTNVETFRTRFVEGKYFEPKTPTQAPAKPSALEKVANSEHIRSHLK